MTSTVQVALEFDHHQAMALAQLVKRFTRDDAIRLSNPHRLYDDAPERDVMLDAVMCLQRSLAEAAISPR